MASGVRAHPDSVNTPINPRLLAEKARRFENAKIDSVVLSPFRVCVMNRFKSTRHTRRAGQACVASESYVRDTPEDKLTLCPHGEDNRSHDAYYHAARGKAERQYILRRTPLERHNLLRAR